MYIWPEYYKSERNRSVVFLILMKGKLNSTSVIAILLIIEVAAISYLLYTVGADRMVEYIGVENGYLIMFVVALLGGLSTFTSVTYFVTVFTLAAAGLNPLGLALASSVGISIGDFIFYYIGYYGLRKVVSGRIGRGIARLSRWLETQSQFMVALFVYMYAAFTPLPNDVLAMLLGSAKQPLRLMLPALVLGNATLIYILVTFSNLLSF